jgi:hypothetical protein
MTEAPEVYPDFPDDDESAQSDDQGVEEPAGHTEVADRPRTGDARADSVLDSLEGLDDRPVGEHAAVFERAHEALRAALEPRRETA